VGAVVAAVVGELYRRYVGRTDAQLRAIVAEMLREDRRRLMRQGSEGRDEGHDDYCAQGGRVIKVNMDLMERGRAVESRPVGEFFRPKKTKVVKIALTGGPCAGKSSALRHLIDTATAEGFDVLTAPEVATLYFNSSYQFPNPTSDTFQEQKFTFQKNIVKLQLQLERCYVSLASSTGRPTIVIFDRGMRDNLAFMQEEEWANALLEVNKELPNGPVGRITNEYIFERYDGVIHLVTAADGAPNFYKYGLVEDDSGGKVFRRETPAEAIEQDQRLQQAWAAHKHHVVVGNDERGIAGKLEDATEAVLAIARLVHPKEVKQAKIIKAKRKTQESGA
jgi:hypothetical protein